MSDIVFQRSDKICNLCLKETNLSWDHIPPKGAMMLTDMWVEKHFIAMGSQGARRVSQNGLKYKTICSKCNSELSKLDRAYIDFVLDFKKYIKMCDYLTLPIIYRSNMQKVKIAKCILGHMLASKTGLCNSTSDKIIRKYVMGDEVQLPKDVRIFYWFYDYQEIIIRNDVLEFNISSGITSHFSVIKSFPIAFAISFDGKSLDNASELKIGENDSLSTHSEINVDLRIQNGWNYPEGITENVIHLVSKDHTSIIAAHKHKIVGKVNK